MSAFKTITNSDKSILPYEANKTYSTDISDTNISYYTVSSVDSLYDVIIKGYYPEYITGSIPNLNQRLQSNNYVSASSDQPSGSYVNYSNISYNISSFSSILQVVSTPKDYVGEGVLPGSLSFTITTTGAENTYNGWDDNNGNIIVYDSNSESNVYIGNIFYNQGLIVVTNQDYFFDIPDNGGDFSFTFKNRYTIYEQTIRLKIKQHEFNYSYNPTLLVSGSDSTIQSFSTTSSFQPYITGIGLYSSDNELMAVAKLGQPLPLSGDTDYNFNIKLDW